MKCNIGQDAIFLIHSEMLYSLGIFIKEDYREILHLFKEIYMKYLILYYNLHNAIQRAIINSFMFPVWNEGYQILVQPVLENQLLNKMKLIFENYLKIIKLQKPTDNCHHMSCFIKLINYNNCPLND